MKKIRQPPTEAELVEWEWLCEVLVDREWDASVAGIEGDSYMAATGPWYRTSHDNDKPIADAAFIRISHPAMPSLLAEVRRLSAYTLHTNGLLILAATKRLDKGLREDCRVASVAGQRMLRDRLGDGVDL